MQPMLALITALLISTNGAAGQGATVPTGSQLEGEWVSDCTPIGENGRHGQVIRLTISRSSIAATGQLYAHNNCDIPTIRSEYSGALRRTGQGAGRLELDYALSEVTFTLLRDDVAAIYNRSMGCGLTDWQVDVPKSVAGRRCAPLDIPSRGQMLFESAWVAGDQLRLGAFPTVSTNKSPDMRPAEPGSMIFHRAAPEASKAP